MGGGGDQRGSRIVMGGALASAALGVSLVLPSLARPVDDAWISFRYASNLADGAGLVWAPDLAVEGYSNLSWTLIVALGLALGAPLLPWMWAVALTSFAGAIASTAALARALGATVWGAIAAAALVASSAMLRPWMGTGLETPLFTFLLTFGLWRTVVAPRAVATMIPWAVLAITRPEGAMYLVIPMLGMWGSTSRWAWGVASQGGGSLGRLAILFAPLTLQIVHRVVSYGALTPNTYTAKVDLSTGLLRTDGLRYILAAVTYDPTLSIVVSVGIALALVRSGPPASKNGRLLVLLTTLPAAALVYVADGDSFGDLRLLAPLVPGLVALAASGFGATLRSQPGARSPEPGAPEPEARSPEPGARSPEPGAAVVSPWPGEAPHPPGGGTRALPIVGIVLMLGTAAVEASIVQIARVPRFEAVSQLGPPWARTVWRADAGPSDRAYIGDFVWPRMEVGWYLRVIAESLPVGERFVFEDIGFAAYTVRDATLLDARGLTWPAAARFARLTLAPNTDVAALPAARGFLDAFFAQDPALVFLTCPVEGYQSPPERALLPDARFRARWRLTARGPYLGGNGRVCLYTRSDFTPANADVGVARYTRMKDELPQVQDWDALIASARGGVDPAGPWRVAPDGTPTPTTSAAPAPGDPAFGNTPTFGEEERQRRIREREERRRNR